jgi:signal transduction histidine kinase
MTARRLGESWGTAQSRKHRALASCSASSAAAASSWRRFSSRLEHAAFVSRLDLAVDLDVSCERLPPDIEASAYFIVAEALTNVVKHARATRATAWAAADDSVLNLEVRDDGVGGANPDGQSLMGIADRIDALGGRLRIESTDGDGTVLAARLPLSTR